MLTKFRQNWCIYKVKPEKSGIGISDFLNKTKRVDFYHFETTILRISATAIAIVFADEESLS